MRTLSCATSVGVVLLLLIVLLSSAPAGAWLNGGLSDDIGNPNYGVHDWVAERALEMQVQDMSVLTTIYRDEFLLGTEAPDNGEYIGDYMSNHSVYYYSDGTLHDGAAATRAQEMYVQARIYMKSGQYDRAAFYAGAMVHYISDVGVFGHTMGPGADWGTEGHHADYEEHFEAVMGSLATPSGSLGNGRPYELTLDLAYKITFGNGSIMPNVWMDFNYNWSDPIFEASAMASLNESVIAAAAAMNHLMIDAGPFMPEFGSVAVLSGAVLALMILVPVLMHPTRGRT